uniref:chromobox protein homolog 7-like n=1 Tax=Euleptes europaea TaxID=460621 RepID=UPI002541547E|nr:chromobox protein homolog 7-like [Euleptes europaea]
MAFRLDLPRTMRIHPVFHHSLLTPVAPPHPLRAPEPPPLPVIMDGEEEYEVSRLVDSRRRWGRLQYLVEWKGYGPEDRSWEPVENLHTPDLIRHFHRTYPRCSGSRWPQSRCPIPSSQWRELGEEMFRIPASGRIPARDAQNVAARTFLSVMDLSPITASEEDVLKVLQPEFGSSSMDLACKVLPLLGNHKEIQLLLEHAAELLVAAAPAARSAALEAAQVQAAQQQEAEQLLAEAATAQTKAALERAAIAGGA